MDLRAECVQAAAEAQMAGRSWEALCELVDRNSPGHIQLKRELEQRAEDMFDAILAVLAERADEWTNQISYVENGKTRTKIHALLAVLEGDQ